MNGVNISRPKTFVFSIAIEDYAFLSILPNAVNDSNAIIKVLCDKYKIGNVWQLENDEVTPNTIKDSFLKIKDVLRPEDSLLVIYNGHGTIKGKGEIAYWQFRDSKERDENTWYKCSDFFDEMTELDVANIALFVNSCFSGNLFHQDGVNTSKYDEGRGKKTRALFTAGLRNEATIDKYDSNKNSPFASAFIEVLSNNKDQHELYLLNIVSYIYSKFNKNDYGSIPRYGTFKGDDGGQFILYLREDIEEAWGKSLKENTIEAFDNFIQKFGESKYFKDAENRKNLLMQERQNWISVLDKTTELIKPFVQEASNKKVAEQASKFLDAIKTKRAELSKGVVVSDDWQKLIKLNNSNVANSKKIDEFKNFIANNNTSDYIPLAENTLDRLEKKVKEEELWNEINNRRGKSLIHIKRGFIQYIHEHTYSGRYMFEANQNLRDISLWIEVDEQIRNKQDLDEGRKKLYEYKAKFPQGLYIRQAEKELSKISIEAQAKKIKAEFEEAKGSDDLNKLLELIEDIENFSDENELAANRYVLDEAKEIIKAYENKKSEEYKKVIENKRVLDLKHFLKLYNDDNFASEEVENVSVLLYEKEQAMYYKAEAEKTIDSFMAYMNEFDDGDNFYDKAKERIEELRLFFSLKNKKEFQDYIKEYVGNGLMLVEAREKIAEIEYEEHKQKKFEDAISMNSIDLYLEYLDSYENDKDKRWYEIESSFKKIELEIKSDKHFKEINKTLDNKNKLSLCISYLNKYVGEKHFEEVQSIKNEIEEIIESKNALDNAINKSDIKLLEEYKQKHSYNIQLADDHIDYLSAKIEKTKKAFLGYLEKYNESGVNVPKAKDAIRYLEALSSREIEHLYEYVSDSLEKEFYDEAQEKIKELEEIKEIENEFKVANEKSTIEAYSRFIRLHGEKDKYKRDLIIEKMSDLKRRKQDNEDFQAAKESGEAQPLAKYIGKYGESGLNIVEATDLFRKRKLGVTEREVSVSNKVDEISMLANELRKSTQRNFYVIVIVSILLLLSIIFNL